jgi:hypothetical protein
LSRACCRNYLRLPSVSTTSHEHVEGQGRDLISRLLGGEEAVAHLRPFAVGNDAVVVAFHKRHQPFADVRGVAFVVVDIALLTFADEGVTAEGHEDDGAGRLRGGELTRDRVASTPRGGKAGNQDFLTSRTQAAVSSGGGSRLHAFLASVLQNVAADSAVGVLAASGA